MDENLFGKALGEVLEARCLKMRFLQDVFNETTTFGSSSDLQNRSEHMPKQSWRHLGGVLEAYHVFHPKKHGRPPMPIAGRGPEPRFAGPRLYVYIYIYICVLVFRRVFLTF